VDPHPCDDRADDDQSLNAEPFQDFGLRLGQSRLEVRLGRENRLIRRRRQFLQVKDGGIADDARYSLRLFIAEPGGLLLVHDIGCVERQASQAAVVARINGSGEQSGTTDR
jgi:hypothetical protein